MTTTYPTTAAPGSTTDSTTHGSLEPGAIEPDEAAQAAQLAGRYLDILNSAAIALLTSIGHRAGLFETLADLPPAGTSRSPRPPG